MKPITREREQELLTIFRDDDEMNDFFSKLTIEREQELLAIFRDDDKMNVFLSKLTAVEFKDYLIHINARVRGINVKDKDAGIIKDDRVLVGRLVSPRNIVQYSCFSSIASMLRIIPDRRTKATAIYYLINNMHLFGDGNGRTSRFVYDLIADPKFNLHHKYDFTHDPITHEKRPFYDFESKNSMLSAKDAGNYASHFLRKYVIETWPVLKSTSLSSAHYINTHNSFDWCCGYYSNAYISESAKETIQDSKDEIKAINYALLDNNSACSIGGLTLSIMLAYKGCTSEQIQEFCQTAVDAINSSDEDAHFWIDDSTDTISIPEMYMSDWSREDYGLSVYIADKLKQAFIYTIIDMFEHPEQYQIGTETVLDRLMLTHPPYFITQRPCYENDISVMHTTDFVPDTNGKIFSLFNNLKSFLDNNPSIVQPVSSLKSQVSSLLSTPSEKMLKIIDSINHHAGLGETVVPDMY